MGLRLYDYQIKAIEQMKTGCILNGGVGSGKSLTSIGYFYLQNGGSIESLIGGSHSLMKKPKDLYIITTARKRDTLEWEGELSHFLMSTTPESSAYPTQKIIIDSWNNIKKYVKIEDAFFILDEHHAIGAGTWTKAFLKIVKHNDWILLTATAGDTWQDYIPVFIANGFYKNRTEFNDEHVVYSRFTKYPKIDKYLNTTRLIRLRDRVLIDMEFKRETVSNNEHVYVGYDMNTYKEIMKRRWDPYKNKPIENASELCYLLRKVVNSDESRQHKLLDIVEAKEKAIIFYNFDYELDILKALNYGEDFEVAEWNGHKHQPIPECDRWVYLVQYNAGAEGWNCIKTDTIIFYSQNYSYKTVIQAAGRIDRLNTPFTDLYYYHLKSRSNIDMAISKALKEKRNFNETKFVGK